MTLKTFAQVALVSLISLPTVSVASDLSCSSYRGTLTLQPDPLCEITQLKARAKWFPDVTFLADLGVPNSCFIGQVEGLFGNEIMSGQSLSGQTTHAYPPLTASGQLMFSAVTLLKASGDQGQRMGKLYFQDVGLINLQDGIAHEQLIILGGTGQFRGARGTLSISGNEFIAAEVTGQICVEVDEE